uniref:TSA: Wollemia nobilis Ref_Wollemi_Transcript_4388_1780 transcribed RNA sequence n=1 Tax=Wollemia nobilis TaxID=56998 RepID=A0A0C9QWA0_9CONI
MKFHRFSGGASGLSPLLRRSSSRPVVLDLAEAVTSDENFQAVTEADPMKSPGSPPKQASSTISPPGPVWRVKGPLFLLWGFVCFKVGMDSVMRMDAKLRNLFLYEAFLYYNPLLLVAMMIWLWGVNIWVFSQSSVNYTRIFDFDPNNYLTHKEIWKCASWMTIIVPTSMTAYLYLYSHGEVYFAASQPVLLYAMLALIVVNPFDVFYPSSRHYFLRTLWRMTFPLQPITFADFFLADVLTSMAKVLSDLERSVCRMVNRQVATIAWFEADSVCGSHSPAIPWILAFPYVCRFFQCLRQYKDTKDKFCLLNALKYATAFPVIFLSAHKYHIVPEVWTSIYRPLWLLSSVINSCYSFYWDVTRDWDLSVFSKIFRFRSPHLHPNMLYGRCWVYYWAIGSNLVLRCAWTYKLSAHLRHNYLTVFAITAMEMIRRFQWIFFRVENEWNKMALKSNLSIPLKEVSPQEKEKLLGSDEHNV